MSYDIITVPPVVVKTDKNGDGEGLGTAAIVVMAIIIPIGIVAIIIFTIWQYL